MTKKEIEQISAIKYEIADLKNQIDNIPVVKDSVRGSRATPPYDSHTIIIEGADIFKADRLKAKLGRKLNDLQDVLYDFETLLDSVPDARMRETARLIYRDGLTQWQAAYELGVTDRTVKRILREFRRDYIDE